MHEAKTTKRTTHRREAKFLSVRRAAELLNIRVEWLYTLIRKRKLHAVKSARGQWQISPAVLASRKRWLAARRRLHDARERVKEARRDAEQAGR